MPKLLGWQCIIQLSRHIRIRILGQGKSKGDGLQELKKDKSCKWHDCYFCSNIISNTKQHGGTDCRNESAQYGCSWKTLAEQQTLAGLNLSSPPVSPILSPLGTWTEGGKRTTEVSITWAESPESSKYITVSPTSGVNIRSSGATRNSCSPLNATSGTGWCIPLNPRAKTEKPKWRRLVCSFYPLVINEVSCTEFVSNISLSFHPLFPAPAFKLSCPSFKENF